MRKTWVLAGDAGRARVLAFEDEEQPWTIVEDWDNPSGRAHTSDLVTDKAGRVKQSGHGKQPNMEPHTQPTDVEDVAFARRIAARLEKGLDDHDFDRLVLVAPPRFLGQLRKLLSDPVARRVSSSVAKDFARCDPAELRERLAESF